MTIPIIPWDDPRIYRKTTNVIQDDTIRSIIRDIREGGDEALLECEERFGGRRWPLKVSRDEIRAACREAGKGVLDAIRVMSRRLRAAEEPLLDALRSIPDTPGMSRTISPIPSVGCYVPGGEARYVSTAVMSVVPAAVAGVGRIVVVSPPAPGGADPATVAAAHSCGAHEIYRAGGAQAVAALTYGTASIPRVHKIVGPGGPAVTAAKRMVSGDIPVDMVAGPTELGIMADHTADPDIISLDMISQAEHSAHSKCFLITDSEELAHGVARSLESRLYDIRRSEIVRASLSGNGFAAICPDKHRMARLAQDLAPEHLQVMTSSPARDSQSITSPGLILLGHGTPSAASDYLLGSNHILPTGGQGHVRGQLSVLDFVRIRTVVEADQNELRRILPHMESVTKSEGLPNHYSAVRGRLEP